jgi:protein TonB
VLSFIVETDGTLSNIQIVRNLDTEFDEECIRVVKAMPKWIPGKQYGQAVRVKYNLPLTICMQ